MRAVSRAMMLIAIVLAFAADIASAQAPAPDTLEVTWVWKPPMRPWYGVESDSCFAIDGVAAPDLTLVRGRSYVFHVNEMNPLNRFYISTRDVGFGQHIWRKNVPTRPYAFIREYFPFSPNDLEPDSLYYQSGWFFYAGGKIIFVDSIPSNVREERGFVRRGGLASVDVWYDERSARLVVQHSSARAQAIRIELMDLPGRSVSVMDLQTTTDEQTSGVDIRDVPAGLYVNRVTESASGAVMSATIRVVK